MENQLDEIEEEGANKNSNNASETNKKTKMGKQRSHNHEMNFQCIGFYSNNAKSFNILNFFPSIVFFPSYLIFSNILKKTFSS